jgi:hypothetical protein
MERRILGPAKPVEVAQGFFELPAPIEHGSFSAQLIEDIPLVVL